ncbi:NAD(P)-dependent oxidoreductase [Sphaerisporangium album]|uniref:NAD(P)-dependent oxidoreductase n=1 Tax=Sphaerisporangium album TaxID=509200 RepID=A0A367FPQ4_9ACTN|nr:NAD(P)-dependent oxidoreductase [Sphaerisporangium album]RCG31687.1 NAD(P)-dependent oxidoreductase [Sphaerisporangium album]
MRVAVIGMGNMGRAVATRLLARGHEVAVWNRTPGRADGVVRAGATEASSPPEAARGAAAAMMSLTDDQAVLGVMRALIELEGDPEPPVIVDMSTVAPGTSRSLRDVAPRRRFLAAPIIGAPQAILDGAASGLVGGERRFADALEPLWPDLFSVHWYCGEDPGAATTLKLVNNYLLMSGIAVVSEAVATAQAAGIDSGLLREVLYEWPTVAPALRNRLDDVLGGDHEGWFTTRLGAKDVRLLAEVAEAHGLSLPVARLVERSYEQTAAAGFEDADIGAIVELIRGRDGVPDSVPDGVPDPAPDDPG